MPKSSVLARLAELARRRGTPLLAFDEPAARARARSLAAILSVDRLLYAVKSNPGEALLRVLREEGYGFEVVAAAEVERLAALGCGGDRLVFASPVRSDRDLDVAAAHGVRVYGVDSAASFAAVARRVPAGFEVLVRLCPSAGVHRYGVRVEDLPALLGAIDPSTVTGVALHAGPFDRPSDLDELDAMLDAAARARDRIDAAGGAVRVLDLGGGFPDTDDPAEPLLAGWSARLAQARAGWAAGLAVWAEPGRALSAPAYHLVTRVLARRDGEPPAYFVDDSVYGSYLDAATCHRRFAFATDRGGPLVPSTVYGCTCDKVDVIGRDVLLPRLEPGDLLYCTDAGAYTVALTDAFNGLSRPIHAPL